MRRTALMFVLAGLVGALVAVPIAVYASHQFTDVPNTNPFHDDIDWLADAQVTLGCGQNVYCPKDFVTREQMAAFMRRLAENQVVDAGTLEGMSADQLANGPSGSSGVLLAGTVQGTSLETTGDITDAVWDGNGLNYTLTFDGEDLSQCSAAVTPGTNDQLLGGVTSRAVSYTHLGVTQDDEALVYFFDPITLARMGTNFHIVIVCP